MHQIRDLAGQLFGKLTVISRTAREKPYHGVYWHCRCVCGQEVSVRSNNLTSGHTVSCGCMSGCVYDIKLKGHPLFYIWHGMIARCECKTATSYARYGGRGIYVSEAWHNPIIFFNDMSPRPDGCTLDRKDNDGPYSKDNCKWSTAKQQQRNRKANHMLTFEGQTRCVSEWEEIKGFPPKLIHNRLARGWTVPAAIEQPLGAWFRYAQPTTLDSIAAKL